MTLIGCCHAPCAGQRAAPVTVPQVKGPTRTSRQGGRPICAEHRGHGKPVRQRFRDGTSYGGTPSSDIAASRATVGDDHQAPVAPVSEAAMGKYPMPRAFAWAYSALAVLSGAVVSSTLCGADGRLRWCWRACGLSLRSSIGWSRRWWSPRTVSVGPVKASCRGRTSMSLTLPLMISGPIGSNWCWSTGALGCYRG